MKVVGPIHKSDVGGVSLNITDDNTLTSEFYRMMRIKDATGVLLQPMLSGTEVFVGAKREEKFGHLILCGLGGIYVEALEGREVRPSAPLRPGRYLRGGSQRYQLRTLPCFEDRG